MKVDVLSTSVTVLCLKANFERRGNTVRHLFKICFQKTVSHIKTVAYMYYAVDLKSVFYVHPTRWRSFGVFSRPTSGKCQPQF